MGQVAMSQLPDFSL